MNIVLNLFFCINFSLFSNNPFILYIIFKMDNSNNSTSKYFKWNTRTNDINILIFIIICNNFFNISIINSIYDIRIFKMITPKWSINEDLNLFTNYLTHYLQLF